MPENERKGRIAVKLLRNVFWLFLQVGVVRFSSFVITVLLARRLAQEAYGQFSYILSLIGMFAIISDMGLGALLLREASRRRAETREILAGALSVKLPLMAASFVLYCGFSALTAGYGLIAALVLAAAHFIESLARFFSTAFNANEKMHMLLIGDAVHKGTLLLLLWLFIRTSPSLAAVSVIYLVSAGLLLLYYAASFLRVFGRPFPSQGSAPFVGNAVALLSASAPMALGGLIMTAYVNTDVILLKWLKGPASTGVYAACYNFYLGIAVVSSFIVYAVVPKLAASLERGARHETEFILGAAIKSICIVALPLSVGGVLLSGDLLLFIYGKAYAGGAETFRIFMLAAPLNFLNLLFSYYLFSSRRQAEINTVYFASLLLNVVLNLILIPRFGIGGAAAATLAAEALFFSVFLYRSPEFISYFRLSWLTRLCAALSVMAAAVLLLPPYLPLPARIALGAAAYAAALAVTGALSEEMMFIKELFKKGPFNAEANIAG